MLGKLLTTATVLVGLGSTAMAQSSDPMFQKGLIDRTNWEQWFNGLQGDEKIGAFYWSGQRSLPHPGSCEQMDAAFFNGCTEAKVRLAASDALRKTEPTYKIGWNAYVTPALAVAASPLTPPPAVTAATPSPTITDDPPFAETTALPSAPVVDPNLPVCDSNDARADEDSAMAKSPTGRVEGLSVVQYQDIRTVSTTANKTVCSAIAEMNDASRRRLIYIFTDEGQNILIRSVLGHPLE